jgi:hypothetical protein
MHPHLPAQNPKLSYMIPPQFETLENIFYTQDDLFVMFRIGSLNLLILYWRCYIQVLPKVMGRIGCVGGEDLKMGFR